MNITSKSLDNNSETKLIADFTEYNPLHNGHFHCMKVAKSQVPDALFVAIVPMGSLSEVGEVFHIYFHVKLGQK